MLKQPLADPLLTHFRAAIDETYGDRLERGGAVRMTRARLGATGFRLRAQSFYVTWGPRHGDEPLG